MQELAEQIDLSDSAGAYLFTGNRGTGKTTELLRLATILRQDDTIAKSSTSICRNI